MLNKTAEPAQMMIRLANALCAQGKLFLRLENELLRRREGIQQGDPASGLIFALSIHPIVRRIERDLNLFVHRWYAYDGIIGEKIEEVRNAMRIIHRRGGHQD